MAASQRGIALKVALVTTVSVVGLFSLSSLLTSFNTLIMNSSQQARTPNPLSLATLPDTSSLHPLMTLGDSAGLHNHGGQGDILFSQSSAHYTLIPQAYADSAVADAANQGTLKKFTLIASSDKSFSFPTGDPVRLMSFNGTYPAPTLRVTQGDVVQVTLINKDIDVHSIDFHGSQLSAVPNFGAVNPGANKTLTFIAVNPGAWLYHCEANNVFGLWEHPLKGMAGMLIVDPKGGYQPLTTNVVNQTSQNAGDYTYFSKTYSPFAREFTLTFGEYYLANAKTTNVLNASSAEHDFDKSKMLSKEPTYTAINGIPFGYAGPLLALPPWNAVKLSDVMTAQSLNGFNDPPLSALTSLDKLGHTASTQLNARQGDHVRFFVTNNGDSEVAFHIVGEQLDRVTVGSGVMALGVETYGIAPYSDAIIDVIFEQPGVFAIVNHDYSELFKGQAAIVVVWPTGKTPLPNPSNAVAPPSSLPSTSFLQGMCTYGIGANKLYDNNAGDDNKFQSRCKIGLP